MFIGTYSVGNGICAGRPEVPPRRLLGGTNAVQPPIGAHVGRELVAGVCEVDDVIIIIIIMAVITTPPPKQRR